MGLCFGLWGGDLDDSAIVDGATIQPEFWTDLYNAMTGDSTYDNVVIVSKDTLHAHYGKKIYRGYINIEEGDFTEYEMVNTFDSLTVDSTGIASGSFKITSDSEFTQFKCFVGSQIEYLEDEIVQGKRLPEIEMYRTSSSQFTIKLWKDHNSYYDPATGKVLRLCIEIVVYE